MAQSAEREAEKRSRSHEKGQHGQEDEKRDQTHHVPEQGQGGKWDILRLLLSFDGNVKNEAG